MIPQFFEGWIMKMWWFVKFCLVSFQDVPSPRVGSSMKFAMLINPAASDFCIWTSYTARVTSSVEAVSILGNSLQCSLNVIHWREYRSELVEAIVSAEIILYIYLFWYFMILLIRENILALIYFGSVGKSFQSPSGIFGDCLRSLGSLNRTRHSGTRQGTKSGLSIRIPPSTEGAP